MMFMERVKSNRLDVPIERLPEGLIYRLGVSFVYLTMKFKSC